jgi:hypothetical protein
VDSAWEQEKLADRLSGAWDDLVSDDALLARFRINSLLICAKLRSQDNLKLIFSRIH